MSITKEILRFEHKESYTGPYTARMSLGKKVISGSISVNFHRQPLWDGDIEEHHYFGFNDLEQLIAWFTTEEIHWLFENEYHLKIYQIDSSLVESSRHQCIFVKKEATQMKVVDTVEEFKKFFFGVTTS